MAPKDKKIEPKWKKEARPTKFGVQQGFLATPVEHRVITGRRRVAILNAQDLRAEANQINSQIDRLMKRRNLTDLATIEKLQSKRKKLANLFEKQKREVLHWDDLYQAGGGPNFQPPPPPPPPPPPAGGGIMV